MTSCTELILKEREEEVAVVDPWTDHPSERCTDTAQQVFSIR